MYRWIGCCVCVCVCKFTCMHGNLHIYLYSSCSQMWGLPFLKGQFHFSYNLPDLTRNKWDQVSSIIQDSFPGSTSEESSCMATIWPPAELTDPWPRHLRAPQCPPRSLVTLSLSLPPLWPRCPGEETALVSAFLPSLPAQFPFTRVWIRCNCFYVFATPIPLLPLLK